MVRKLASAISSISTALILTSAVCFAGTQSTTLAVSGTATETSMSGSVYGFTFAGTGSLSGIASGTVSGGGTFDNSTGVITLTLTMDFGSGNTLTLSGTGSSMTGMGSLTVTGGAGSYSGATGSFPSLLGSGTPPASSSIGATGPFGLAGQGSITLPAPVPATPAPGTLLLTLTALGLAWFLWRPRPQAF